MNHLNGHKIVKIKLRPTFIIPELTTPIIDAILLNSRDVRTVFNNLTYFIPANEYDLVAMGEAATPVNSSTSLYNAIGGRLLSINITF